MRIPLATDLKTRTGVPDGKDARLVNSYVEVKGEQSVVRKRPIAQGGVAVGSGTAQGGIGLNIGGVDYVYTVNGDTGALDTLATAGTAWASSTTYAIGDHVSVDFVDYWAAIDNTNSQPPSVDWSNSYVPPMPFAGTYATWNPLDKAFGVSLSGSDLIVTTSDGGVRSTIGKSSGKWFWEVTINSGIYANPTVLQGIGVMSGVAFLGNEVGNFGTDEWGFNMFNGSPYKESNNMTLVSYGSSYSNGDVIGVALDMDGGSVTFYVNGVSQGVAFSGISGTIYAAIGMQTQVTASMIVTANFGASAFAYAVPSGYNSGLYTL